MTIIIVSRLVTDCKAIEVHSEHRSWIDGKKMHDYQKRLTSSDHAYEEHERLEQYCLEIPGWHPGWEPPDLTL